ncbi:putative two-component sensor histidine kinase [Bradyrhizobium sp. ORS 285]|uniref:hybrid sensor histidine kinase/response regulator n=1 Tax=Bradyrhizobium sp. ORS 285 TaxID=115808 RepID=UPI0002409582|nr:hybrid sensor histidine kinase/response regulator [Bradyrhizobium sp. ORS 285]CCD89255.1 putative two-component sensor histidine kinase [Bradyrhizobium sp. ORS 285]SMX56118.1 putative two-component sensor histidine kinase [Bradyrhizobium sp. ORS 285]
MPAGTAARARAIYRERIQLFFRTRTLPYLGGIRVLQAISTSGAACAGLLVWLTCNLSPVRAAIWTGLVVLTECLITNVNDAFRVASPSDEALPKWGWAKAALCGLNALAWSLSPLLLHVDGAPASVLMPLSIVIFFVAIATWIVGADYTPSMWIVMVAAIVPAALSFLSFDGELERVAGFSLLALLPFIMATGIIAAKKAEAAINIRLDISELLDIKAKQAQQIEALFAERTRFFSAASHDLRQPLNAMGLYFELLARSSDHGDRNEIIARLQDCASSLLRQFDAIMGVSATDADIRNASVRAVPVHAIFLSVASTLDLEARRKALRLRVRPSDLWCAVDPALLERVLLNLVGNAIKYTDKGTILIGARRRAGSVRIQVIDTGIGIEPQHLDAIFDDFFQVGNPERNRDRGLGIGLAIVRRLCAAMDWPLEVKSAVGRGTSFSLTVPMADAVPASADIAPMEQGARLPDPSDPPGILVIDDDATTRDSLGRVLTNWGYECAAFDGGTPALRFLEQEGARKRWIVLLDYRLAGPETGLGIADKIIAAHASRTRLVMMTGDIGADITEGARARGILLLRKPVQPIRLSALLGADMAAE